MSDADALLQRVKDTGQQVGGQGMSTEKLDKAKAVIETQSAETHQLEAAAFTEDIIQWLNVQWNDREFTPEQRIFSISLATINLRNHFPNDRGGKEFFDKVAKTAWEYYAANAPGGNS